MFKSALIDEIKSIRGVGRKGARNVAQEFSRRILRTKAKDLNRTEFKNWVEKGLPCFTSLTHEGYRNLYEYYQNSDESIPFDAKLESIEGIGAMSAGRISDEYSEEEFIRLAREKDYGEFVGLVRNTSSKSLSRYAVESLYDVFRHMPTTDKEKIVREEVGQAIQNSTGGWPKETELRRLTNQLLDSNRIEIKVTSESGEER